MAEIIGFPRGHARVPSSEGYKSGRSSWRGTPDARSTASTRNGGTSFHCETACTVIPTRPAKLAGPPTASIARLSASLPSAMTELSSIALGQSQAALRCADQDALYAAAMSFGGRIKAARERLGYGQSKVADHFGVTVQAVSNWENNKDYPGGGRIPELRRFLRVTYSWLHEGSGPPPDPFDPRVLWEDSLAAHWAAMGAEKEPARKSGHKRA